MEHVVANEATLLTEADRILLLHMAGKRLLELRPANRPFLIFLYNKHYVV